MENYLICKCKKVTYADVEDALHNEKTFESVEKSFEDVQKITKGEIYRFETDKKHNYKNETQQKTSFICVFVDYR